MNLRTSQLQSLKQQINPHFLFNALNTIYAYALKENKDTPALILKLSELLDYTLYQTEQSSISLEQELDSVNKYLAIEKERFKDSLDLNYQRKNEADHHIIPLLFLPLIENAFKHGSEEKGRFKLEIYLLSTPEMLTFKVFNRCKMGSFKEGLGLSNLRDRLNIAYDEGATLSTFKENGQFVADILINFDMK